MVMEITKLSTRMIDRHPSKLGTLASSQHRQFFLLLISPFLLTAPALAAPTAQPSLITVGASAGGSTLKFDAVVEAERQATLAAQVTGNVLEVGVKVGDRVRAGQVLVRIDARAAEQQARAGGAQALVAKAQRDLAAQELARQRTLYERGFISKSAFEQAEARWKAADAESRAQIAAAEVSRTQTDFHIVRAPFAGIVAEVPVNKGDVAFPGKPLIVIYEPGALRVTAAVSESLLKPGVVPAVKVELPRAEGVQTIAPTRVTVLPVADAATHTVQLRASLSAEAVERMGLVPGAFARIVLPAGQGQANQGSVRVKVPASAMLRRAELDAVYVAAADGSPQLRLVRVGRRSGEEVEILSGLKAGERIFAEAALVNHGTQGSKR